MSSAALLVSLAAVTIALVLIGRIRKIADDQQALLGRIQSISPISNWIQVRDEDGSEVTITGKRISFSGPHTHHGPELHVQTVPGTAYSYPWEHHDGRVTHETGVRGGGFDLTYSSPTLQDMPLPPRIRLEFRDDTLTVRTWRAKIEHAEWQTGDDY
jgi:hypothetical protein